MNRFQYEVIERYEARVSECREYMCSHEPISHNVCVRAKYKKEFDRKHITEFCSLCLNKNGKADFDIISLIRLLYTDDIPNDVKEEIISSLLDFPFWPHEDKNCEDMKQMCFWTENHIFMLLSSAVLFRQKMLIDRDKRPIRVTELEYQLLRCFLKAHLECVPRGLHEVLSCVYLSYTLASLINIIDFALDFELTSLSIQLADIIVTHLMHITSASGICSLTPAARTYPRFLNRTFGHNINNFIYCMTGEHPDNKNSRLDKSIKKESAIGMHSSKRTNTSVVCPTPGETL